MAQLTCAGKTLNLKYYKPLNLNSKFKNMKEIAVWHFSSEIFKEYSASHVRISLGMAENNMTLYLNDDKLNGCIDWEIDYADGDGDTVSIGLWFNDKGELTDYDGVFSLPNEAISFLETRGFNCDYAKD